MTRRGRAGVELVRAPLGDGLERAREPRVAQHLADLGSAAERPEDRRRLGPAAQDRVEDRAQRRLRLGHDHAVARKPDRRSHQLGPGQAAVAAVGGRKPRRDTPDGARSGPDQKALRRRTRTRRSARRTARPRPVRARVPGTATKKSRHAVRPLRGSKTSMKPPPPGPLTVGSHTHEATPAATQASTADPPRASTSAPDPRRHRVPRGDRCAHGRSLEAGEQR